MSWPVGKGAKRKPGGGHRKRKRPTPGAPIPPDAPKAGRPTGQTRLELEPKLYEELVKCVELCDSLEEAAASLGVSKSVAYEWKAMGEEQPPRSPLFAKFAEDIERARAEFALSMVRSVKVGAQTDPRIALKVLEARREDWRSQPGAWREKRAAEQANVATTVTFVDESGVALGAEVRSTRPPKDAMVSPRDLAAEADE